MLHYLAHLLVLSRGHQVASLLTVLCLSINVSAQITSVQERDLGIRNQQELQRQQQQEQQQRQQLERAPDVRLTAPEKSTAQTLPIETPCFLIERLQLQNTSGVPLPAFDWVVEQLTAANAPVFIGQCMGAQGVAWFIERTQKILLNHGFVTSRVLATQQDISQGTLVLTIIPGRIHEIRWMPPLETHLHLRNALPMKEGDVLNLRDVEQALENFKRLPTAEADIQIEPAQGEGSQLGDSDLVIAYRQSFPLRLSMNADDSGTKATGRYQGSVTVSLDNPLALNDMFYVTQTHDMGGGQSGPRGTKAQTVHYSVPTGYWTVGGTSTASKYYQTVAGLNGPIVYSGTSENNEIKASRLLMRDSFQKVNWAIRAFQRKSNNYINDTEVGPQRRIVGGWDSTLNHKAFIQDATLESSLTYKRGTGAFGSLPAPEEAFNEGTSRFALITADANLVFPFRVGDQRIRYNGTWRVQSNRTPLTPQDRFAIGGRYTVRGYDGESVLSAERGWLWRNDWNFALGDSGQEMYMALDTGRVGGSTSELLVGKQLTGAAIGIRGTIDKLRYEVFVATPVSKPEQFQTPSSTAGFSFSVSY
mgnify:CR=1 FL=1